MNQYSAIREVRRLLRAVMEQSQRPELIEQLEEIDVRLKAFHDRGIDFKEVVDGLDDSIMITDAEGTVLYINLPTPATQRLQRRTCLIGMSVA